MKAICRYIGVWFTLLVLSTLCLGGMLLWMSTGTFFSLALGTEETLAAQQSRVNETTAALAQQYGLTADVVSTLGDDVAERFRYTLADWWHSLWRSDDASCALPTCFDPGREREMVALVMADEGFAAMVPEAQRRAVARDEVVYAVDEAVCSAVLPLRRSVIDLGLSMVFTHVDVHSLAMVLPWAMGALAVAAVVLLMLLRRAAGSILLAQAGLMALLSLPVWLLDLHGMLRQLSSIAAAQGDALLWWMALPWYGAAVGMALAGLLIIRIRNGRIV